MHDTYLELGSHGEAVLDWQSKLNFLDIGNLTEDGVFGEYTQDATIRFQHQHGLTADGIVGPHTTQAMEHVLAALYEQQERHHHQHHEASHHEVAHHENGHHEVAHEDNGHHEVAHHENAHHEVAHHATAHHGTDDDKDDKDDDDKAESKGGHGASLSVNVSAGGGAKDDKKDDDKSDAKGGVSFGVSASLDFNKLLDQLAAGWHALVNAGVGVLTCAPLHMSVETSGVHMRGQKSAKLTYHGRNDNIHAHQPRKPEYGSSTVPLHVMFEYGTDRHHNQLPTSVHVATGDGAVATAGSKITVQVTTYKAAPLQGEHNGHPVDIGALYLAVDIKEECTFAQDANSSCILCIYGDGRAVMATHDDFVTFEEH
jgi:hypothetical protein